MSEHHPPLETLPEDIAALIEEEKARPGPSPEARDRMLGLVAMTVGVPHLMPDGGIGASATGAESAAAQTGAGASATAASVGTKTLLGLKAKMLIPFVVGAVSGVGGTTLYQQVTVPPPVVEKPPVAEPAALPASADETPVDGEVLAPAEEPVPDEKQASGNPKALDTAASVKPPATSYGRTRSLSSERTLIEMARSALSRGNGRDALAALNRHKRSFPKGKFVEEREALSILALLKVGNVDKARDKAIRFKRVYPRSMFVQTIDAAFKKTDP